MKLSEIINDVSIFNAKVVPIFGISAEISNYSSGYICRYEWETMHLLHKISIMLQNAKNYANSIAKCNS